MSVPEPSLTRMRLVEGVNACLQHFGRDFDFGCGRASLYLAMKRRHHTTYSICGVNHRVPLFRGIVTLTKQSLKVAKARQADATA